MNFQTGDHVEITCEGRTVDGVVSLASPSGMSLVLSFEAVLNNHGGIMPVLRCDDSNYIAVLSGAQVIVRSKNHERH